MFNMQQNTSVNFSWLVEHSGINAQCNCDELYLESGSGSMDVSYAAVSLSELLLVGGA